MASDLNISVEKSAPDDRHLNGPFDESEVTGIRPYVDLGAIRVEPREGLNLRLEVEEGAGRIVAVNLDQYGSTLQVQPFAASRSSGLWHEIRHQVIHRPYELDRGVHLNPARHFPGHVGVEHIDSVV